VLYTVGGGPIRHEQTPPYSGTKIIYTITENTQGQARAMPVAGGTAVTLPAGGFGARRWLEGFDAHLSEACVGSISEIFDADSPYIPRGCVAQAWSVAEVLRILEKTQASAVGSSA